MISTLLRDDDWCIFHSDGDGNHDAGHVVEDPPEKIGHRSMVLEAGFAWEAGFVFVKQRCSRQTSHPVRALQSNET